MLMTIFCIIISVFVLFFSINHFSGIRDLYKKTAHVPGPLCFPLIGCIQLILGGPESILKKLIKTVKKHTSPIRIPVGSNVYFLITNPEQIKTALYSNKTVEKEKFAYKFISALVGKGLVTAENKLWRVHRKLLQPTFAPKVLESFVSIFQDNSLLLTQAVEKHVGCLEVDLSKHIAHAFFNNICESSMGVSIKEKRKEIENFMFATERNFELMFQRFIKFWLYNDKIFNLSQIGREFSKYKNYVYSFTRDAIQDRIKYLQTEPTKDTEDFLWTRNTPLDLMLELSENGNNFTVEQMCEHLITFIIAGYDTGSRTVNFVLLMLASHPDVQDRVYEEIFNIYGDEDVEKISVKYEDLQHLKYLERVIKETMRLFPVVPIIARQISEEFELGGYLLPEGCGVVIYTVGLHRDERLWHNPLQFNPDRFLPQTSDERHPCSFIPFSFGSRDCLGRVYAMISMKITLATFLRKYTVKKDKITPVEDIRIKMDLLLTPAEPITLRLEKRKK